MPGSSHLGTQESQHNAAASCYFTLLHPCVRDNMIVTVPHLNGAMVVYMRWEPNSPKALAMLCSYGELSNS